MFTLLTYWHCAALGQYFIGSKLLKYTIHQFSLACYHFRILNLKPLGELRECSWAQLLIQLIVLPSEHARPVRAHLTCFAIHMEYGYVYNNMEIIWNMDKVYISCSVTCVREVNRIYVYNHPMILLNKG